MNENRFKRPNRLTEKKDWKYCLEYAKFIINDVDQELHSVYLMRGIVNWSFYKGNQWIFNEDLDAFLMDESGEVRNRIKFVRNIVKTYVEYFRGTAIRMDIGGRAVSISRHSLSRRNRALSTVRFALDMAKAIPGSKDLIASAYPIGDTDEETLQMFDNLYEDVHERDINKLISAVKDKNKFESLKVRLMPHIALDGLGILKEEFHGEQVWKMIEPKYFFWDRSAREDDLTDAQYMGDWSLESKISIFEQNPSMSTETRTRIENADCSSVGANGIHNMIGSEKILSDRVPVYNVFWQDLIFEEYGCIKDANDNYVLELITEDGDYTKKDLVSPPDGFYEDLLGNIDVKNAKKRNKSARVPVDKTFYCKLIPSEYISDKKGYDIVLSSGIVKYQSRHSYNSTYTKYPYKVKCWMLTDGEVLSPVDDLIDPQRMMNRMLSMAESQVNNSRGSGIIYDKDMVDSQGGEQEFLKDINLSKPAAVSANGRLNNSVMPYDNTVKAGTFSLFQIADTMKGIADSMFGGGDALLGQGGAHRVSVGALEQNLNQATTVQEPVFYTLSDIIMQSLSCIATRGKSIYINSRVLLHIMIGEEGYSDFVLSDGLAFEEFKYEVKRSNDKLREISLANGILTEFLSSGIIDKRTFAKYYNLSSVSEVAMALREFTGREHQAITAQQKEAKRKEGLALEASMIDEKQQQNAAVYNEEKEAIVRDESAMRDNMEKLIKNIN